jgi:hypothetical protein
MFDTALLARFESKVDRSAGPDGCHIWTGARIPNGYGSLGRVPVDGVVRSQVGAHRIAFAIEHGYWPTLTRHTCDNPPCVNPRHLLDGTVKDNSRDMLDRGRCPATKRTHCPKGHSYTDENTMRDARGHRRCRECMYARNRARHKVRMAENAEQVRADSRRRQRAYRERQRLLPCSVEGCDRPADRAGKCGAHYQREWSAARRKRA